MGRWGPRQRRSVTPAGGTRKQLNKNEWAGAGAVRWERLPGPRAVTFRRLPGLRGGRGGSVR